MRKQFVAAVVVGVVGIALAPVVLAQDVEMPAPPAAPSAAGTADGPARASVTLPARGSTMSQVENRFGAPAERVAPVGQPPISRWVYPSFIVYFEHDHVVHAVVTGR